MYDEYKLMKTLGAMEVEEKMEMGLCLLCDEPFTLEHQLLHHKNIQIIVMDEEEIEPKIEGLIEQKQNEEPEVNSPETYTPKIDVLEEKSAINSIVTNQEKSTLLDQRHPTIASAMPPTVQLLKGVSTSRNFSIGLSAYSQKHSSSSTMQHLGEVKIKPLSSNTFSMSAQAIFLNLNKLKYFDTGGIVFLLFLPISSIFILVQFPSRVSLPIIPPSKPPDWVVVPMLSFILSLIVTTIKHSTSTKCLCIPTYFTSTLQVFDQMSKSLVGVWNILTMRCISYESEGVSLDSSQGLHTVVIKLFKYTFTNLLHWCSLKFFIYGRHINNIVIKRRLLVRIYVVNSLAIKCFNHMCVLVVYGAFEEVGHALHFCDTLNYMIVSIVSMDRLEDVFVVFRDKYWYSFFPIEASRDNITLLGIHNSYDNEIGKSQLLANYHDAVHKLLIVVCNALKPFADFLCSSSRLQCFLQELVDISEINDRFDSLNGFKILLQQSQELEHELQLIHTWSYWSYIFHDGCRYILANIYCYFYDNAMGRGFDLISKIGDDFYLESESLLKVVGENVVWFRNLELNFLKRHQLNLKCVQHYHKNDFIYVVIFECQNFSVVAILHRKMINWGNVQDAKILIKWKGNFSVVAILHRKMINWGNIQDAKILIKWKALPLKHGTCDCSFLRTRMFEGEGIVTGIKY